MQPMRCKYTNKTILQRTRSSQHNYSKIFYKSFRSENIHFLKQGQGEFRCNLYCSGCRLGDSSPEVWSLFCITFCLSAGLHLKSAIKTLPHEWSNKEENFYKFSTRKISEQNKFTWLNKSPWLSLLQVLVPRHSSQVVFQTNTFGTVAKFHHIKTKLPLCP